MVLGTVSIGDWHPHTLSVRERYLRGYRAIEGHRHVHGANLGVRADSYWSVGGFAALVTGEDVDLVTRVSAARGQVCWAADVAVQTSSRRVGRAPQGFAAHLRALEHVRQEPGCLAELV